MDVPDPIHEDRYVSPPQVAVAIGWLATSIAVVATGVRFGTKLSMRRMVNVDDFLIVGALVRPSALGDGSDINPIEGFRIWSDDSMLPFC